jgi:hypothetical protein
MTFTEIRFLLKDNRVKTAHFSTSYFFASTSLKNGIILVNYDDRAILSELKISGIPSEKFISGLNEQSHNSNTQRMIAANFYHPNF